MTSKPPASFSRRQWLRGAGGALLSIPFLPSLLPRRARAQGAFQRRFVFVGSRWGRDLERGFYQVDGKARCPWYPTLEPAQKELSSGAAVASLSDIADEQGHVSAVFSEAFIGLHGKYSLLRGLDGMQVEGSAHATGMTLTASGSLPGGGLGFGYSLDAILEEAPSFYTELPFAKAVRSCVGEEAPTSFSFSARAGKPWQLPSLQSPLDLYHQLFHPESRAAHQDYARRAAPVLNGVMEDYERLMAAGRLGREDQLRLEAHLSMISDVERALGVSLPACDVAEPGEFTSAEALHELTMDLEVAALACGLTRVVTHVIMQHSSSLNPNTTEVHGAAHHGKSRIEDSVGAPIEQWKIDRWVMARVARFIEKLDAVDDGDGSLLDHSVLLYGNWESRGFHSFYDMPVVVAGSPDVLAMGKFIDYRPQPLTVVDKGRKLYAGRPYNQLLVTLFKALGVPATEYERFGRRGFGYYDGYLPRLSEHYRPFLMNRNAPLPILDRG